MATYSVAFGVVEHDGARYDEGSMLPDLTEDQVVQLLAIGAISLAAETPKHHKGKGD